MNILNRYPVFSEELELWQQLKKGNSRAFETLMSKHSRMLFSFGCKYSNDNELVKNCIQDLFLDLWQKRDALNDTVIKKTYLMASLRRRIFYTLESRRGQSETPRNRAEHFSADFSVEESLIENETSRNVVYKVKHLIEQLPEYQQEVVYLKFFQNLDRDHISEIMCIDFQSVSDLLQMAIRQLKAQWKA